MRFEDKKVEFVKVGENVNRVKLSSIYDHNCSSQEYVIVDDEMLNYLIESENKFNTNRRTKDNHMDDTGDYRSGLIAAAELEVKSPLREAGLTKADIRQLSKEMVLHTWDKLSFACLCSGEIFNRRIKKVLIFVW